MSSSRSTEQRSHCSRVNARCMIFLTIFSRSVCSSNRSLTTSNSAYVTTIEPYRNVGYSLTLVFLKTCRSSLLPDSSHTLCETLKTTWHWKLICHRKVDTSAAPEQKSKKEKKKSTPTDMQGRRKRAKNVVEEAERFDYVISKRAPVEEDRIYRT